jgi:hypothetical protein
VRSHQTSWPSAYHAIPAILIINLFNPETPRDNLNMKKGNLILIADLALDFLAIAGVLYLFSQGYFSNLSAKDLNTIFLRVGIVGLVLAGITVYLLLKKD